MMRMLKIRNFSFAKLGDKFCFDFFLKSLKGWKEQDTLITAGGVLYARTHVRIRHTLLSQFFYCLNFSFLVKLVAETYTWQQF